MATLRTLRHAAGLTLDDLATRTHLHKSILSKLENDKRRLRVAELPLFAKALGCEMTDLLPPHFDTTEEPPHA